MIADSDSPTSLLSSLSDKLNPLPKNKIIPKMDNLDKDVNGDGVYQNYLYYFKKYNFIQE